MKTPRTLAFFALLLTWPLSAVGPGKDNDFQGRRVLFIGIDGVRRDVLQNQIKAGKLPHLQHLTEQGTFFLNVEAGGHQLGPKRQPTISGPGWSTLLNGVFVDKHLVTGNDKNFSKGNFKDYPHFFKLIRQSAPKAWLGTIEGDIWPEIHHILLRNSGESLATVEITPPPYQKGDNDTNSVLEAVKCLTQHDPDVLFIHIQDVDHAGHGHGFHQDVPPYLESLDKADGEVGKIIQALESRPKYAEENWLVLITTDHGGINKSHGGQTPEERHIFAIARGEGFAPGATSLVSLYQSFATPLMLMHLGIPIQESWNLEENETSLKRMLTK